MICNKAGFLSLFGSFIFSCCLAGATLVDRVQIMGMQEQNNNILEAQRITQHEACMQSAKTALATLITPPPSAGAPILFPALPSLPST